jgi:hypothetical protein
MRRKFVFTSLGVAIACAAAIEAATGFTLGEPPKGCLPLLRLGDGHTHA